MIDFYLLIFFRETNMTEFLQCFSCRWSWLFTMALSDQASSEASGECRRDSLKLQGHDIHFQHMTLIHVTGFFMSQFETSGSKQLQLNISHIFVPTHYVFLSHFWMQWMPCRMKTCNQCSVMCFLPRATSADWRPVKTESSSSQTIWMTKVSPWLLRSLIIFTELHQVKVNFNFLLTMQLLQLTRRLQQFFQHHRRLPLVNLNFKWPVQYQHRVFQSLYLPNQEPERDNECAQTCPQSSQS